ncbi:hypothetical protein PMAYCL1PPCAC_16619, partial [Pristionchus mayeri]
SANDSLRFNFEWDRDYLLPFSMLQQKYMPIIGSLTVHPIIFYVLLFDNRSMRLELRISYFFTYLVVVLDEWMLCFAFRFYVLVPYSGLYCEGPICRSGWNEQWLMSVIKTIQAIISFSLIAVSFPFSILVIQLHQMFVPVGSRL